MDERGDRPNDQWPSAGVWREVLLALGLLLCYGFFIQAPAWNEYSRYDLIRAVVEEGTTQIDDYHENTGDKAFYDGHYYSDKAPGTAILGVPVYAGFLATSRAAGIDTSDAVAAVGALAFVISGISTVILVLLLIRFLVPLVGESWAIVVGLGYGLGSIAFPFATMLFGHALSAAALFAAFFLLHRWRRTAGRWEPVGAGLLAGWAVLTEIPVVLGVVVLAGYALWLGRGVAVRFVLGGIPVALALMAYNWLTFGSPLSLGYQYSTLFAEQNQQGIVSIVWPSLAVAVDLLFSARGLIVLAPWFVLAPFGLLAARNRAVRAEVVACAAICVAFLVYNSGAINAFGGWTPGPRYLLPALPFAAVLVALAPARLRSLTATLIAVSVATMFLATITMPNAPEAYENPLVQLWIPRAVGGELADTLAWRRWGFSGLQPLALLLIGLAIAVVGLWASRATGRTSRVVTIASAGLLALVVVACALPFPAPATVRLVGPGDLGATSGIAFADSGTTRIATRSTDVLEIWAQLENAGAAVDGTRLEFRVLGPGGERTWSGAYGDVAWTPGERRTTRIVWNLRDVVPGDYLFEAEVIDEASGDVLASAGPAQPVTIR
jgi:hypothetical protein